jgi:hypothetical protein
MPSGSPRWSILAAMPGSQSARLVRALCIAHATAVEPGVPQSLSQRRYCTTLRYCLVASSIESSRDDATPLTLEEAQAAIQALETKIAHEQIANQEVLRWAEDQRQAIERQLDEDRVARQQAEQERDEAIAARQEAEERLREVMTANMIPKRVIPPQTTERAA